MSSTPASRTQKLSRLAAYGSALVVGDAVVSFEQHHMISAILTTLTVGAAIIFGFKAGRLR